MKEITCDYGHGGYDTDRNTTDRAKRYCRTEASPGVLLTFIGGDRCNRLM